MIQVDRLGTHCDSKSRLGETPSELPNEQEDEQGVIVVSEVIEGAPEQCIEQVFVPQDVREESGEPSLGLELRSHELHRVGMPLALLKDL